MAKLGHTLRGAATGPLPSLAIRGGPTPGAGPLSGHRAKTPLATPIGEAPLHGQRGGHPPHQPIEAFGRGGGKSRPPHPTDWPPTPHTGQRARPPAGGRDAPDWVAGSKFTPYFSYSKKNSACKILHAQNFYERQKTAPKLATCYPTGRYRRGRNLGLPLTGPPIPK